MNALLLLYSNNIGIGALAKLIHRYGPRLRYSRCLISDIQIGRPPNNSLGGSLNPISFSLAIDSSSFLKFKHCRTLSLYRIWTLGSLCGELVQFVTSWFCGELPVDPFYSRPFILTEWRNVSPFVSAADKN